MHPFLHNCIIPFIAQTSDVATGILSDKKRNTSGRNESGSFSLFKMLVYLFFSVEVREIYTLHMHICITASSAD